MPNKKRKYEGITHEERIFCLNILAGYSNTEAYRLAYPKASKKTAECNASKKLSLTKVSDFLEKRRAILCGNAEMKVEEHIRTLEEIAHSKITDFVTFGKKGVTLKECKNIPPDLIELIESVGHTDNKFGTAVHLKLNNKIDALLALLEMHGKIRSRDKGTTDKDFTLHITGDFDI